MIDWEEIFANQVSDRGPVATTFNELSTVKKKRGGDQLENGQTHEEAFHQRGDTDGR